MSIRPLRLVIAEDSPLLREGLVSLLARFGHTTIASVEDAVSLVGVVRADPPDVLITDVRMPPGNADDGLRAAVALRAEMPALPVLVLSQYVEQSYAAKLLDSGPGAGGGVGYLLKDRIGKVEDFLTAVEQVAAGETVIDPDVVRQLIRRRPDPIERLSPREQEVLALMAEGRSNATIGARLHITDAAVNKHIGSIFTKLDLPVDTEGHRRVLAVLAFLRS